MRPHLPAVAMSRRDFLTLHQQTDRILVVVFLRGGADGLTLVPPIGDDRYYASRPTLAVKPREAIALNDYFAIHQSLRPLLPHYESGEMAIMHGCGSEDDSRSHFEAQDTMEHAGNHGSGWLGRYLRARPGVPSALSAVAIGTPRPESMRGAPSGAVLQSISDFALEGDNVELLEQLQRLYARAAGTLGTAGRDTVEAVRRLRRLRADYASVASDAMYPDTNFARGLREIARLIKAEIGLTATTIDLDGWDTHFVQGQFIEGLMTTLAGGLDAFLRDLGSLRSRVDIAVMTEFGRRLGENTSFGTDHGTGGVMMLLGPAAQRSGLGGTVTAGFPNLSEEHRDEFGDIPATLNYRDYLAPVLQLHTPGIDLRRVFPE